MESRRASWRESLSRRGCPRVSRGRSRRSRHRDAGAALCLVARSDGELGEMVAVYVRDGDGWTAWATGVDQATGCWNARRAGRAGRGWRGHAPWPRRLLPGGDRDSRAGRRRAVVLCRRRDGADRARRGDWLLRSAAAPRRGAERRGGLVPGRVRGAAQPDGCARRRTLTRSHPRSRSWAANCSRLGQRWGNKRHGSQTHSDELAMGRKRRLAAVSRTPTHPNELGSEGYGTEGQRFESSRAR